MLVKPEQTAAIPAGAPRSHALPGRPEAADRSLASRPLRILHATSEFAEHHVIRHHLAERGQVHHDLRFAGSYDDAVRLLGSDHFDVALIDAELSGDRGLELIRVLGGRSAPTPFVLLGRLGDLELDAAAIEAGAFDQLDRSELTPSLLLRTLRNACVRHDIEQRLRQSEQTMRRAVARAEAANKAKTEFLARISHDLRTPLNAILGFSEVIGEQVLGPVGVPKYREYARDIHDSGQHLLGMIDDLLDLSKIEAGRLELEDEPLDLEALIAAALRIVGPLAEAKAIRLSRRCPPGLPQLTGDRQAVRRMLLNLMANAIRYTPDDGRILVEAWHDLLGLHLAVQDSGVGIAREDIHRVLQPFQQARRQSGEGRSGTGLGLPIVNGLIALHGGSLTLESQPGKGTRVSLTFPRSRIRSRKSEVGSQ